MRSSTSSSDRPPPGPWGATGVLALAVALAALGGWEALLRGRGYRPGLVDEPHLWATVRAGIGRDRHAVALLGDSRVQLGIHLQTLARVLPPARPAQLAIAGTTPVPVLEDLARDTGFSGVAVMGYNPGLLFRSARPVWERPRRAAELARTNAARLRLETRLTLALQRRAAFRRLELSPVRLIQRRLWPPHAAIEMLPDRSRLADYGRLPRGRTRPRWAGPLSWGPMLAARDREAVLRRVARAARAIEERGGRVVLLRMPSTGAIRAVERERMPRSAGWDSLVASTGLPSVHFEDHVSLRSFDCPDGSHLDGADAPAFTRALTPPLREALAAAGDTRFGPLTASGIGP